MTIKTLIDEDFINYKKPAMFIGCKSCDFKCDKLAGKQVCQNGTLANSPNIRIDNINLINRYLNNPMTKAIVFGGLEPFDDIDNVLFFISELRKKCNDDVVIYTGYTEEEIENRFGNKLTSLKQLHNIIIKFGRFIPDQNKHYDNVIGVNLASDNQYAKKIS